MLTGVLRREAEERASKGSRKIVTGCGCIFDKNFWFDLIFNDHRKVLLHATTNHPLKIVVHDISDFIMVKLERGLIFLYDLLLVLLKIRSFR